MMERALVVEQPEQQRADAVLVTLLVPAKARHDTIAVALVLDLEHHALVRLVGHGPRLRDDAVEPGAFEACKPICCDRNVWRGRRQIQGRLGTSQQLRQALPPPLERQGTQVALTLRQQIEKYDRRRSLFREHTYTRCRRMNAHLQRVEVERALASDHDFTVERTAF